MLAAHHTGRWALWQALDPGPTPPPASEGRSRPFLLLPRPEGSSHLSCAYLEHLTHVITGLRARGGARVAGDGPEAPAPALGATGRPSARCTFTSHQHLLRREIPLRPLLPPGPLGMCSPPEVSLTHRAGVGVAAGVRLRALSAEPRTLCPRLLTQVYLASLSNVCSEPCEPNSGWK